MRIVEIFEEGAWRAASWSELQPGVLFRLFEGDGTPVDGGEVCRVVGEVRRPYPAGETFSKLDGTLVDCKEDNWVVACEAAYESLVNCSPGEGKDGEG